MSRTSLGIVRFDGTDDEMQVSYTGTATQTWFAVAKTSDVYWSAVMDQGGGTSSFSPDATGVNWAWALNSADALVDLGGDPTIWSCLTCVFTSTSSAAAAQGTDSLISFDPKDNYSFSSSTNIGSGNGFAFFTGDIAEILIYDLALGTTDRENVRGYLIAKWGL